MRTKTGAIVDPCNFPEIYVNPTSAQRQTDGRRAGLKIRWVGVGNSQLDSDGYIEIVRLIVFLSDFASMSRR